MNIGDKLSKAIKEGKWLNISYVNQNKENTKRNNINVTLFAIVKKTFIAFFI